MKRTIDLNCDVGEAEDDAGLRLEHKLFESVTSANIAAGAHAGNARTIALTIEAAQRRGVGLGAHPSYPDREHFGRRSMQLPADELQKSLEQQITAVALAAGRAGTRLRHVKPHGALYNDAARDRELAALVASAIAHIDAQLVYVGLAGSLMVGAGERAGLRVAGEAFCDRAYEADGSLRSRLLPGALIMAPAAAARQAVELAHRSDVETLCVHSDTPGALAIARAVRAALEADGFTLAPL